VTTQPQAHTGQGIFFTSKMADLFTLEANGLRWVVDNRREDVAISEAPARPGTTVTFELPLATATDPAAIFARYSHGDDFAFDTSRVVVRLFEHGSEFVSRSEAKRIAAGLERFRHVIVDFRGVEAVGQGFADELFRVWATAHPEVALEPMNMQPAVERVVRPSRARDAEAGGRWAAAPGSELAPGWSEHDVATVLDDPDAVTHVAPGLVIATRRNVRRPDWTFLGIVAANRGTAGSAAARAFILRRAEAERVWSSPTEALDRVFAVYGRRSAQGATVLDEPRYARALADLHIRFE
jgi:uncharacterized protein (DUF1330 family)